MCDDPHGYWIVLLQARELLYHRVLCAEMHTEEEVANALIIPQSADVIYISEILALSGFMG